MPDDFYVPKTNKGLFAYASGWVVAIVALLAIVGAVMGVGTFAFSWFAAPYQGKLQFRQQVNSGDFRLAAYQQFFQLCASVQTDEQALDQTIENEKVDRGQSLSEDRTNYTGQLNSRNDAANTYNAATHEVATFGAYKAKGLPYEIGTYEKGQVTQCATS